MQKENVNNKPVQVLLAEDDADDRELFIEAFSVVDAAIQVKTVDTGEKLIDHLNNTVSFPDWIFLDLNMPKKNGVECLQEIKDNEKIRRIPVIIYTTSVNAKDVDATYEGGASCFIRKPNSFTELTHLLKKLITSSSLNPSLPVIKGNFVLNSR
jgi:CheY-like chemotaxis protein